MIFLVPSLQKEKGKKKFVEKRFISKNLFAEVILEFCDRFLANDTKQFIWTMKVV
jgi:hypothetical protein